MFRKIRHTAYIIGYRHKATHPDLPPMAQAPKTVSRISLTIGSVIQLFIIVFAIGLMAARASKLLFPHELRLSLETLSGIFGALAMIIAQYVLRAIESSLHSKMGNPLAPYFGHKIEETVRTIKGHST